MVGLMNRMAYRQHQTFMKTLSRKYTGSVPCAYLFYLA